jgi:hypothetical protein
MTRACIIVASHISKSYRLKYLCECLKSLLEQTVVIPIFLSISFENEIVQTVYKKIMENNGLLNNTNITIYERKTKTSQFRHIFNVFELIKYNYDYIMFCDDDDTYVNNRVELFINAIEGSLLVMDSNKKLVGVYEQKKKETHFERFHEYWSYCIGSIFIEQFITKINEGGFDKYVEHDMFDVLFSSYLRFLDSSHVFVSYQLKLYNYRKNTTDSVVANIINTKIIDSASTHTGFIRDNIEIHKQNIFLHNSQGRDYNIDGVVKDLLSNENKYLHPKIMGKLCPKLVGEINKYYQEIRQLVMYMGICYKN